MTNDLIARLTTADVVCRDCGSKYGKCSVFCSSMRTGTCHVCGETKPITEVRGYGYLEKGIEVLRTGIKNQSKVVAEYMRELKEDDEPASYELGEMSLMLTKEEVGYLNHCLDLVSDARVEDEDIEVFDGLGKKLKDLYADYCVEYELSPVVAAYYKKYGTYGNSKNEDERDRYQKFSDNYSMLLELGFIEE